MARYARGRISALLRSIEAAPSADAKGEALESLGRYLFSKVRGLTFEAKNVLDGVRAHELDLAFSNDPRASELPFADAIVIIECKATAAPVGSSAIGWFIRKLQDRGAQHAILISLAGVTGGGDRTSAAYSEVLNAMSRDGIRILLLVKEEILGLSSSADLTRILKQKLLQLVLYRTVR